jgi:ABC-type glutathione transport system ATPase component
MPLLEVQNLSVRFPRPGGTPVDALRSVSMHVEAGEALGVVGESGSGKSTLARAMVGLTRPTQGRILYEGTDVSAPDRRLRAWYCRQVQMVFQDATGSLNPRMTVQTMLDEVFHVHRPADAVDSSVSSHAAISRLLEEVGLPSAAAASYPRELSGGQCQRVSLARCLALEPRVLVADEPVSALDVSVQARVLNLLCGLQQRLGLALVLVSHDLAVVRTICSRVYVLREGSIVEEGLTEEVLTHPQHPYTRELLAAVPDIDRALAQRESGTCSLLIAPAPINRHPPPTL